METIGFVPLSQCMPFWPTDIFGEPEFLDEIGFRDFAVQLQEEVNLFRVSGKVLWFREIAFDIPGIQGFSVALLSEEQHTTVPFEIDVLPEFQLRIQDFGLTFRLDTDLLQPVREEDGRWLVKRDSEGNPRPAEIRFENVGAAVDLNGNLELLMPAGAPQVSLGAVAIGQTGVILEIDRLTPYFSTQQPPPAGAPVGFRGVAIESVKFHLPNDWNIPLLPSAFIFERMLIGTGGFSGVIRGTWNPTYNSATKTYTGQGSGTLFDIPFALRSLEFTFQQNVPSSSSLRGEMVLPFFEHPVAVEIGIGVDGALTAVLSAAQPEGVTYDSGLVTLERPGLLRLKLESIAFEIKDGIFTVKLAGEITPLVLKAEGLEWPSFKVDELSIDSKGNIHLEGGWLNVREKYEVNFRGFKLEITKLGFGKTDDGGKWIGFSGGVKLVAGMPAGASVEGLRITWHEGRPDPPKITLNGVRVNFEVPNAVKFSGAVSYRSDVQRFEGSVKLDLIALKMQVDATAVFGVRDGKTYLAIYLAAEFPAGIPLFATGLGIYGMAGLMALNMEPNRQPDQAWYELGSTTDWYHTSPLGVTGLEKWTARTGSMAFGAGVTLATVADNGHTFSGKMLLAIIFPGPILLLQGSASLLQERTKLDSDANFRALAVLDGRAGTLILGLDAQYRYDNSGALIDIRGAAEGFFNFNDPKAWRLNVGQREPRARRLTARLFQLFESYAYVMLDAQQLAMGAWIGFKQRWQFGPLGVAVEAWIDGNARVSWKPAHFYGDLTLHGSARLSVFGFTAGLTVHAGIKADVFDPFHVVGNFSVAIDLPWPFPDFGVNITLEWGPIPTPPPIPLPLKEVAVEHFKSTVSWPIPRIPRSGIAPLLLPNYDNGEGFLQPLPKPPAPPPPIVPDNLNQSPVVPMDSRPHITFGRNIHDEALVGVNAQPVIPQWEQIGDPVTKQGPARIKYSLEEVVLEKLTNPTEPKKEGSWSVVARKGKTPNQADVRTLYGSWAPVPQMPAGGGQNVGQVKLWLWSKTPFEYTRRSSRAWDEWFNDRFDNYPCSTVSDVCWNFEQIEPGRKLSNPWQHPNQQKPLRITSSRTDGISVINLNEPVQGSTRSLCVTLPSRINIDLPESADIVRIRALEHGPGPNSFSGHDAGGNSFPAEIVTEPDGSYFEISGHDIIGIDIDFKNPSLPGKGLASGLAGAIGCDYIPSRNHLVFVEFNSGKLSFIDLTTGKYVVLGTGYTKPEDIVVTTDGNTAFITERVGTLLRVELTPGRADRSKAVVLAEGQAEPQQVFLDEAKDDVYVVEFVQSGGTGKVLRRDMGAPVHAVVVADNLNQAVGLLVDPERNIIYVSEQSNGGRILRIDLNTGSRETVIGNLPSLFFMRWADAERTKILVPQRDPHNRVYLIDLATRKAEVFIDGVAHRPSSVALLPEELVAICSDQVIHACRTAYCLLSICDIRGTMLIRNTNEQLVRWSQSGEVLEPYTHYRLKIKTFVSLRGEKELAGYSQDEPVTEYAYFRTDGPPGVAALTAPIGSEVISSGQFASGLEDLTRYVRRTVPRVPPPTPDSPLPSRPFYRAYDVGVEFDENYVELMYRLGRRDLTLQFFGGNGPALDDQGLRLLLANRWGRAEQVMLTEREERWLSVLTDTGCALVDPSVITKNTTLTASAEPHVFPPSSLCEVRLIPALLHEDFGGYGPGTGASGPAGSFGRWLVQDDAGSLASRWEIGEEGSPPDLVLVQKNNAATNLVWSDAPDLPASEQPGNWTDYRFSTFLRSGEGTIGVVFRYKDPTQHYRFEMNRENGTRKLIRFPGGDSPALKEESFTYEANRNYLITVEAIGPSIRVCLDGILVFAVNDSALSAGRVGLYCAGSQTARFTDVRVDDLRVTAPVVYRFSFLTSRFKNFSDHLSSFAGKAWRAEVSPAANIAPLIAAAALPAGPLSDSETRTYDSLISHLPSTAQPRSAVQVTRIEQSGQAIAFLVQSPEPFDWKRINLQVLSADLPANGVTPPIYTTVDARVLRKADGAGFFVVVPTSNPPGSFLPPALYRFTLTYRRNNRSIDPDSEILSEAGNSAAEQATLDIPLETL